MICDVCLQCSGVCRGTTAGPNLFGDRVRITTIESTGDVASTGVAGVLLIPVDGDDIPVKVIVFLVLVLSVVVG